MSPARLCFLCVALLTVSAVGAIFFPRRTTTAAPGVCSDTSSLYSNLASDPFASSFIEGFLDIIDSSICLKPDKKEAQSLIKKIKIELFYGPGANDFRSESLDNADKLVTGGNWNASRRVVLFIPGWSQEPNEGNSLEIIGAYAINDTETLMVLDWYAVSGGSYRDVVAMLPPVGAAVAAALDKMARANASFTQINVMGHSMGAQLAGFVARNVTVVAVPSLVLLDPAGPLFFRTMITECTPSVSGADAPAVTTLHTDWGRLGGNEPLGCVDVMINAGTIIQPGCSNLDIDPQRCNRQFCGHVRAVTYWSAAIKDQGSMIARKCPSRGMFAAGNCSEAPTIDITQPPSSSDCGLYYLTTNAADPFGKGMAGT